MVAVVAADLNGDCCLVGVRSLECFPHSKTCYGCPEVVVSIAVNPGEEVASSVGLTEAGVADNGEVESG